MMHLAVVALVLSLAAPEATSSLKTADGRTREYLEHMPAHVVDAKAPLPVLIVLHGGGGSGEQIEKASHIDRASDAHGFLVVYPDGIGGSGLVGGRFHTWDASGSCCGSAMKEHVDDVAFLAALVDDVAKHHTIDRKRVFVLGHSNGAVMAERALCEKPALFAGGVIVSSPGLDHACTPKPGSRVLIVHGTADQCASYTAQEKCGGCFAKTVKAMFGADMPEDSFPCSGAEGIASYWRAGGAGDVVKRAVGPAQCSKQANVELCTIASGGHAFPGGEPCKPGRKMCDEMTAHVGTPAALDMGELAAAFMAAP